MSEKEDLEDGAPEPSKEERAKAKGWSPRERWKGHPDDWVDADRFLEIAENSLPFVKAQNRKLEQQNEELRRNFDATRSDFDRRLRATEAANRKTLEMQKRNLIQQYEDEKRAALEIEDPEHRRSAYNGAIRRERDALHTIVTEERALEEQFAPPPQQQSGIPPEVEQWGRKNPWVNYVPDELRVEAVDVMRQLEARDPQHTQTSLAEKLDSVTAVMRRRHPSWFPPDQVESSGNPGELENAQGDAPQFRRKFSAVAGGSGISGGRAQPKGKTFKDLPAENKSAFNMLIREGRLGRPRSGEDEGKWRANMEKEYAENYWTDYGE